MCATDGIERRMVSKTSRNSGRAEMIRVARAMRASRARLLRPPVAGMNAIATIAKSNVFQPLRKKRIGRGQYAVSRIAISMVKIACATRLKESVQPPTEARTVEDVSKPMTTAFATITARMKF
jgi:hypothetical protein